MEDRVGHWQAFLDQPRAQAQQRHHAGEVERAVEVGAADPRAGIGQHVAVAAHPVAAIRSDPHDREVAGAAAAIGDQHQFLALHRLLVVMGGRDRFVDEGDVAKADAPRDRFEDALRTGIGLVVAVDEAHRPAVHHRGDLLAGKGLGLQLEVAHEGLDDFGERHHAIAQAGLLLDQRGPQDRLQGAHQAALGLADIGRDRLAAVGDPALGFVVEEHRARHQGPVGFQRRQRRRAVAHDPDGRVRGAEIQSAGDHVLPLVREGR